MFFEQLRKAEAAQFAHRGRAQVFAAGLGPGEFRTLRDGYAKTGARKKQRCRRTGGAAAGDENVYTFLKYSALISIKFCHFAGTSESA